MTDLQMRQYWFELAGFIQTGEKTTFLRNVLSQMNDHILEQTAMICAHARKHFNGRMFTGFELEEFAKQIMSGSTSKKQIKPSRNNYDYDYENRRRMQQIQRSFDQQRESMDRFREQNQRFMDEQLHRMQEQSIQMHHHQMQMHMNNMFNGF